jgi:NAD(P)H-dependent FMN reductase
MSSPVKILLVSGSLRSGSTNTSALRTAAELRLPGIETALYGGMNDLPHFNPDDDAVGAELHPAVVALRAQLDDTDAILFCTPEYAGALPGSFKNLLDWTVGGGQLYEMPAAWINVAGPGRGGDALASLRKVLGYTNNEIVEDACVRAPMTREMVGEDEKVADPEIRAALETALRSLAEAAIAHRERDSE